MPAALVTGSAKGIGKALILALAEDGYDVAVHYRSSRDAADSVVREASKAGVRAIALQADVTRRDQAEQLVASAHQVFGSLDVLINNVGDYYRGPLADLSPNTWHAMFDSNLHATFYTCQKATGIMRNQRRGRIINIGYAGAENLVARPAIAAYAIAKTGVILYSKALAKNEAANGITVNVINPGVMENSDSKPFREIPMGRSGHLAELVATARFLLAPEAAYVTGVTIEVAGGWNL
ncbi:MAG: bifunctional dihydropteridine reductase/dihydrofolate reductase TmpR [Trueperaceae bacterium]|nr:MAG: bifunctional dihydropteridine reductase/dihydrofolate reductase TmpR [Trueperaceae bacterium]